MSDGRTTSTRARLAILLEHGFRDNALLARQLGVSRNRVYQMRQDAGSTNEQNCRLKGRPVQPGCRNQMDKYLRAEARRRGIPTRQLSRLIIDAVLNDHLINAVLDDAHAAETSFAGGPQLPNSPPQARGAAPPPCGAAPRANGVRH